MSRELILIPKARLETLLKLEKLKQDKSITKSDEIEREKDEISKEQSTEHKLSAGITNKITNDELRAQEIAPLKKQRKPNSKMMNNQHGRGKPYINMSPKQFLDEKYKAYLTK